MTLLKINPKVKQVTIGIRKPYAINLYPLSVGDEIEFVDLLRNSFSKLAFGGTEAEFMESLYDALQQHIRELLFYVVDKGEWEAMHPDDVQPKPDLLKNIDNEQLAEIVEHIYAMNFESVSKKFKGVMTKLGLSTESLKKAMTNTAQKNDLSLDSYGITPNTDFETSLDDDSKTEDLPNIN